MLIETNRLIITEFTVDMAQDVQKNSLDEDNRRFVPDEVWETVEEAEQLPQMNKLGIVSQTTFSGKKFKEIVASLLDKSREIKILRTICTATDQRQAAAMELASKVDLMLVIGGKNSANTTRLAQLCADRCQTYHIETAEELQSQWLNKIEKIGITAGASTPDWIIKEVYKKCQKN